MKLLDPLKPIQRHRIYDLVRSAGVNVDDWGNYKGGPTKASQNPKYCYEWAFIEPGKFIVLALWFDNMQLTGEEIYQEPNPRATAEYIKSQTPKRGTTIGRARRMDNAIRLAYEQKLPVKVIVCDGQRRDRSNPESKPSKVSGRKLDSVPWAVTKYDSSTGNCVITRASQPIESFDQFSAPSVIARKQASSSDVFVRDRKLRDAALRRACGYCEYCGKAGFETANGYIYLETHHIVPLSEGGADSERNIIALCANDHRKAHYSKNHGDIRKELEEILSRYYA